MKPIRLIPITIILLLAAVLSACSGAATAASSWPGLTADAETAYLAYNEHLYAINLSNGQEKWRFPRESERNTTFYASPSITDDGHIIVGSYNNNLYMLDQNGNEVWAFSQATNRYIGSSLVYGDLIFAPNAGNKLFALNTQGNLSWTFESEGALWAQPATDPDCNCIFLSSMDHRIYSIDAQSGILNWETEDLGGSVVGKPAYHPNGTLYVGTFGNEVIAIDASDGEIKWRTLTSGWVWGGPVLLDERLYFGDLNGTFYALDANNGQVIWQLQPDGPISDPPSVNLDTVYFNTEAGTTYAVDLESNIRWTKSYEGTNVKLYTSPIQAGDLILIAPIGLDQLLVALDAEGNQQWSFTPATR